MSCLNFNLFNWKQVLKDVGSYQAGVEKKPLWIMILNSKWIHETFEDVNVTSVSAWGGPGVVQEVQRRIHTYISQYYSVLCCKWISSVQDGRGGSALYSTPLTAPHLLPCLVGSVCSRHDEWWLVSVRVSKVWANRRQSSFAIFRKQTAIKSASRVKRNHMTPVMNYASGSPTVSSRI